MKRSLTMSVLIIILTILTASMATGQTKVVYPASESGMEARFDDLIEIIKTALEKTIAEYGPYTLEPSRSGTNEARYLAELFNPAGI